MRDRPAIYSGLVLFLGVATLPIWHNLSAGATPKGPEPRLPAREKQCVAPVAYMKAAHMDLLRTWREGLVREDARQYHAADGRTYRVSLTATCLEQCHGAKADFCDRCHTYAAVSPSCWDCHLDASPALRSAR